MKFYPTYWQSLGLLLLLFLCTAVSLLITMPFISYKSSVGMSLIYTLSMAMAVGAALYTRKDYSFALKKISGWPVAVASVVIVCMSIFIDPLTSLIPTSEILKEMIHDTYAHPIAIFLTANIAAPILEELFFRGIMLDGLLKNYNAYKAIVFSALLFAAIHGNLNQGVGAFLIGILIGWMYWKTKSVIPGIIIHFVNNLVATIATWQVPEKDALKTLYQQVGNPVLYWVMVLAAGGITLAGSWLIYRKFSEDDADLATVGIDNAGQV